MLVILERVSHLVSWDGKMFTLFACFPLPLARKLPRGLLGFSRTERLRGDQG